MKKMLLSLLLVSLAFGAMPVPMGDFTIYTGQMFYGEFDITDTDGPEGLTIESTPDGLRISEPNITTITGGAKKYVYKFEYTPTSTGVKVFDIKATDTTGIVVSQQIRFTVIGNTPHVFTGCRQTAKPVVSNIWEKFDTTWPIEFGGDTITYMQALDNKFNIYSVQL